MVSVLMRRWAMVVSPGGPNRCIEGVFGRATRGERVRSIVGPEEPPPCPRSPRRGRAVHHLAGRITSDSYLSLALRLRLLVALRLRLRLRLWHIPPAADAADGNGGAAPWARTERPTHLVSCMKRILDKMSGCIVPNLHVVSDGAIYSPRTLASLGLQSRRWQRSKPPGTCHGSRPPPMVATVRRR